MQFIKFEYVFQVQIGIWISFTLQLSAFLQLVFSTLPNRVLVVTEFFPKTLLRLLDAVGSETSTYLYG